MGTFAIENNNDVVRFINILNNDTNPILNIGDECYVMIWSIDTFHLPLICKAKIVDEKIVNIIDKIYTLQILDIRESETYKQKAYFNKCFEYRVTFNKPAKNVIVNKNVTLYTQQNAFFIRQNIDELLKIKENYLKTIKNDLKMKLQEINDYVGF